MRHNCNYKLAALIISSAGLWAAALVALAAGPSPGQLPAQRDEPSARARWLMGTLCIARAFGKPGAVGPALDEG